MTTFSPEQLNFFKFSTVVLDEFPPALRQVFVYMWDNQVAPTPGFIQWDDSPLVRNMFLKKEGGKTKYVPTNKSFTEWDCTALFEATLFAQSFAMPDGRGGFGTLAKLYVNTRRLLSGMFHPSVISPCGNQAETFALALDQLRLLRNILCHQISTQKIDKATFDNYIQLAKNAFVALGQSATKIDDIGKLGEKDFPTPRVQQLEEELRKERLKQIEDNLDQITSQVKDVGSNLKSGLKDVMTKVDKVGSDVEMAVEEVKTKVHEVGLDVKTAVTEVKKKVDEVGSDMKTATTEVKTKVDEVGLDVKTAVAEVEAKVDEVGSDVKTAATDVKKKVDEVGSDVKRTVAEVKTKVDEVGSDVKTAVAEVKTKVDEVGSDVKTAVAEVKTKVDEVGSDVKIAVAEVKTKVDEVGSDVKTAVAKVKTKVDEVGSDMKTAVAEVKTTVDEVASDVKTAATEVKTKVDEVGSDVKTAVAEVKTKVDEVGSDVKTAVAEVEAKVDEVGSDVKTAATEVKKKVGEVGSDVKTAVAEVKTKVDEVGSDVKTAVAVVEAKVDEVGSDVKTAATEVKKKVDEVGSDVKTAVAEVKTKVDEVGSEVKTKVDEFMKDVKADMKQAMQEGTSKGPFVPDSCVPDTIPHFVGRQAECQAILDHLTKEITRLVNVWGPPGFGKTSVAINVAHSLQDMKIPVYFVPLRGMESKEGLVSKLLSIFANAPQVPRMLSSDWLIQCLQQMQNPFVLILDNADDLLESEDAKRKQQVFRFIDEILAQCKHIKLLLTTRESLDSFGHTLPIHLEKINVLDDVSSASLAKLLLPDVSESDRSCIVEECGQVPLAIRLMCCIMREENISLNDLLEERKSLPLIDVLDSESFRDDVRLKSIINKSFQKLSVRERNAFVSLAVFPGWFRIEEATAILDVKTELTSKKIIRSLERKALIDCGENFHNFTIHSLLRSFIDEKRSNDKSVETVFLSAQHQFNDYYISSFRSANGKFLMGPSNEALAIFIDRQKCILLSLADGVKDDRLYPKVVEVLSRAEIFLSALLRDEEVLFEHLYDIALQEAKRRQIVEDERQLLAAKSFRHWGWFSPDRHWDYSLYAGCINESDCPPKLLCYHAVHQLLCGKLGEDISSLLNSVDQLSNCSDEELLKVLVYTLLTKHLQGKDDEMTSHFRRLTGSWFQARMSRVPFGAPLSEQELCKLCKLCKRVFKGDDIFFSFFLMLTEQHKDVAAGFGLALNVFQFRASDIFQQISQNLKKMNLPAVDSEKFVVFDQLFSNMVEWVDQVRQGDLSSMQSYNAAKRVLESLSIIFGGFSVSCAEAFEFFCGNDFATKHPLLESIVNVFGPLLLCKSNSHLENNFVNYYLGSFCIPFEIVLKSNEQVPGVDFVDLARSYDNVGMVKLLFNGDYNGAIDTHQQAIRVREENIGDHLDTVSSLTSIGCLYFKKKNASEAEKVFRRALELRKRLGVYDDVDTAGIYFTLGENHYTFGNYEKALEAHLQALQLRKKHLTEHPLTAKSFCEVGCVYRELRNYPEALKFSEESLAMRLEFLGEHEDTATNFNLLGCIHFEMGEDRLAVQAFEVATDLTTKLRGDHQHTATCYHNLGYTQLVTGDLSAALECSNKALSLRKKLLGDHHPQTGESLKLLNGVYEALSAQKSDCDLGTPSQNSTHYCRLI